MAEAEPSASGLPPPSSAAPLEWEDEEPSERQVNAFVLVFLAVLAFSMILSHQMGHKFKVCVTWIGVRACVLSRLLNQITPMHASVPPSSACSSYVQFKYLAEAGAVVLVGALMGGIIMLSSHGHAQEWLSKSISPTIFFIGASTVLVRIQMELLSLKLTAQDNRLLAPPSPPPPPPPPRTGFLPPIM